MSRPSERPKPIEWIGRDEFSELFGSHYNCVLNNYGLSPIPREELESLLDQKIQENLIDFADLNEPLQEKIIRKVSGHSHARIELQELNPILANESSIDLETITENKRKIEQTYSLKPSGIRLQNILQTVATSSHSDLGAGLKNSRKILLQNKWKKRDGKQKTVKTAWKYGKFEKEVERATKCA